MTTDTVAGTTAGTLSGPHAVTGAATDDPTPHGVAPSALRRAAMRDILAVSPGIVPFGLMLGITVVTTGTGGLAGVTGAGLVFGGSAQLSTISLLHLGAGLLGAVLSGIVVNARILLYGAALEPMFRHQPLWFRLLGAHFIQDQTFLSASARTTYSPSEFRRYWAWLGFVLLAVWTGSVALGLAAAPLLPPLPHLGLVGATLFVAMLVPRLVDRASVTAAAVAAGTALVLTHTVPDIGILGGTAAGVVAALIVTRRSR
jgi:predicted branched-subunit amino acid permease